MNLNKLQPSQYWMFYSKTSGVIFDRTAAQTLDDCKVKTYDLYSALFKNYNENSSSDFTFILIEIKVVLSNEEEG